MVRNLFVFGMPLLVLGLLFSRAEAEEPPSERGASGMEAELLRLEKVWNEAHLRGDAQTLDRLSDDQLAVIVPKM